MKRILKAPIAGALAELARAIIRKYQPKIVMVTGSVGKTSTKDAVAAALSTNFRVRTSEKSFNSDFGVPFTIIGVPNPWASIPAWMHVFVEALALIFFPNRYPNMLVLEVGADRPGDLKRILKIATPDAVVVTLLPSVPVHVEAYETPAAVRDEEFAPAMALPAGAPLVISSDDEYAYNLAKQLEVRISTFGPKNDSTVQIKSVEPWFEEGKLKGMQGAFVVDGREYPMQIPGVFGKTQLNAPAAALALALALGMTARQALTGLAQYQPPPGRGHIFAGKKDTLLIDDTYNSSPIAASEILESLKTVKGRRVAILGDMLELGRYSAAEHIHLGHIAKDCVDILITVGARARVTGETAVADGMAGGSVIAFNNSNDAAHAVEDLLKEDDTVLIKGSQGVRLERVIKALLADSNDASNLVRQEKEWLKR